MKYTKITLTGQVVRELNQALDLIETDNFIVWSEVTQAPIAEKDLPVDSQLDCDASDDESEGSPE